MPSQCRVLAHGNRRALTVHAAGASTPRTCAAPAGGKFSQPTHPPQLTTHPGGASDNGRTARGRPRPSFPRKTRTPGRRRPWPGARRRPSAGAMWPLHLSSDVQSYALRRHPVLRRFRVQGGLGTWAGRRIPAPDVAQGGGGAEGARRATGAPPPATAGRGRTRDGRHRRSRTVRSSSRSR